MKAGLQLRISQNLALTPQLQHAIRLLQASTQELQQELEQMLAENPFLEQAEEDTGTDDQADPPAAATSHAEDAAERLDRDEDWSGRDAWDDWSSGANERDSADSHASSQASEEQLHTRWASHQPDDDESPWSGKPQPDKLSTHLHQQALALRLDALDRAALYALVESLNEDGYLEDSLDELALALQQQIPDSLLDSDQETLHDHLRIALGLLQSMEPPGVGARDLAECLRLQLLALPRPMPPRARLHWTCARNRWNCWRDATCARWHA